ncbi:gene transfer agent family protein [Rhizobium sp. CFBP 13726]|uniref:gene transfer agent family protein n=1 Tax=Rhizobium sp. CFBP 13726 TaxID=2775296 RepID=UPI001785C345|nr:gene transfer agent family protein [Rhizobium sp. CFBP 13726]MBD8650806.1 gene transfer agent family protein [Rhizobium sp. CFBP 13726]
MPHSASKTAVVEFFGDGEKTFDLVDDQWRLLIELETTVGSVMSYFGRLRDGKFRVVELRETIRLGLIGGGTSPADAHRLVSAYFDRHPVTETLPIALAVSAAALFGAPDDGTVIETAEPEQEVSNAD